MFYFENVYTSSIVSYNMSNLSSRAEQLAAFDRLLTIMDELRAQCPWDKKQTTESLRHLTIEETFELSDAILEGNPEEIKKEVGDLLLHLVFYAKIEFFNSRFPPDPKRLDAGFSRVSLGPKSSTQAPSSQAPSLASKPR